MNLLATIVCLGTFLYILSSLTYQYEKQKNDTGKKTKNREPGNDREALVFFAYQSAFATLVSLGGEEYPKYLIAFILLIILLNMLINIGKDQGSTKRKLHS